ncbi:DUF1963 domain-containing protein [Shimazuella sp. AN120528]|uniref:DUF1963 domain-containing protein n=1 Tax=Shimazuella soli TaxID=1892854 RepID=UPI001F0F8556|nr:DUF1963 domain-containing protein [Shimazuella soli]MCH5583649.1 DUF1963 domain-containing protein [Shimazuella soli]
MIHIPKFAFAGFSDAKEKDNDVKFGGLPVGLPIEKWPVCKECEGPMTFLFQMKHHPTRLPLGKEGRVLYLFQCESEEGCSTWDAEDGCNKVLILEQEEWNNNPITELPDEDTLMLPDLAVTAWETKEETGQENWTHFGGTPIWIQSDEEVGENYQFAVQLDNGFRVKATDLSELPIGETSEYEGKKSYQLQVGEDEFVWISELGSNEYYCPFANFGDSGSGYVFINADSKSPSGKFIWQCY